jgi:DNA-binding protein H-NS
VALYNALQSVKDSNMTKDLAKEYNLDELDKEELVKLGKLVDKALNTVEKRRQKDAREAAKKAALEFGYTPEELFGSAKAKSAPKSKAPPKYANPNDQSMTWTGKGRQPEWIKEYLRSGKDLADIEIK